MASPTTNRQQNFVSRMIQGNLLRQFGRDWFIYNVLLWHGLFLLRILDGKSPVLEVGVSLSFWDLYLDFARAHVDLAVCAVAIFPLFLWKALRLSHRIAGPLERFRYALESLQRGEQVKPLTLRRDDLLVDYQRAFNRYLAHLERETRSRAGLPKSTRAEPDAIGEPASNPLILELEKIQAEVQQAANNTQMPDC